MANGLLGQYHLAGAEVEVDEKTGQAWRLIPATTAKGHSQTDRGGATHALFHNLRDLFDGDDDHEPNITHAPTHNTNSARTTHDARATSHTNTANHANHPSTNQDENSADATNTANSTDSANRANLTQPTPPTPRRVPIRLSEPDRDLWLQTTEPAARAALRLEDQDAKRTAATRAADLKARLTKLAQTKDLPPAELRKEYLARMRETAMPLLYRLVHGHLCRMPLLVDPS